MIKLNKSIVAGLACLGIVAAAPFSVHEVPMADAAPPAPRLYVLDWNQNEDFTHRDSIDFAHLEPVCIPCANPHIEEPSSEPTPPPTSSTSASSAQPRLESMGVYKISAYCPCVKCCGKTDGITASGAKAVAGVTIAMNGVPFGTRVMIDGHEYIVQDRGGALGNRIIDVFFNTHSEALSSGLWIDKEVFRVVE